MGLDNTQIKLDLTKVMKHLNEITCSNCPLVVSCDILNEMLEELK